MIVNKKRWTEAEQIYDAFILGFFQNPVENRSTLIYHTCPVKGFFFFLPA